MYTIQVDANVQACYDRSFCFSDRQVQELRDSRTQNEWTEEAIEAYEQEALLHHQS